MSDSTPLAADPEGTKAAEEAVAVAVAVVAAVAVDTVDNICYSIFRGGHPSPGIAYSSFTRQAQENAHEGL